MLPRVVGLAESRRPHGGYFIFPGKRNGRLGMSAATSFTPKSTTVGSVPNPYVGGYVYTNGPLALGSSCVTPLLEIRNALCGPLVVWYESGVETGEEALANRQVLPAKSHCLLTGLFPSAPDALSKIRLEDLDGNTECWVLEHDLTHGYDVAPLHAYESGQRRRERPTLDLRLARAPYAPQFQGCSTPAWGSTVIVPLRASRKSRPALQCEEHAEQYAENGCTDDP